MPVARISTAMPVLHPNVDETVILQEGDIDFVLWQEGRETVLNLSQPGSYVVVPRGIWHTARPRKEISLMFFTPPSPRRGGAQCRSARRRRLGRIRL